MEPLILLILGGIVVILILTAIRRGRPGGGSPPLASPPQEFTVLRRGRLDGPPAQRVPSNQTEPEGFEITAKIKNPAARCLMSGKPARDCTCDKHRSVR